MDSLIRFTLTVRKNYRNVPYHNWDHAFSVAHAMFTVLRTSKHRFTPQEVRNRRDHCLVIKFSKPKNCKRRNIIESWLPVTQLTHAHFISTNL